MTTRGLREGIGQFKERREALIRVIEDFRAWQERHGDATQAPRLRDMVDAIRDDRLILAFVAEFSRGKTELINALFFSDFKQRLLPSDAGRTTMCPTEIFHDPGEPPYIRLLPIETRLRDDSITALKGAPGEWTTQPLDVADPDAMRAGLRRLAESKTVFKVEAQALGLWDEADPNLHYMIRDAEHVEVPAWRYALVNFPHPLLDAGLSILDTPGLNAMGAEPELTLSALPNAHALLFLLATDTGVTQSDYTIWSKWVARHAGRHYALLNKIDMLWDELKSPAEIAATVQRQIEATAAHLAIPPRQVLAVSAQKALVARVRGDAELLERSGIGRLEALLAEEIIPSRGGLAHDSLTRELAPMLRQALETAHARLAASRRNLADVEALSGKNQRLITDMRQRVLADRQAYDDTARNFHVTRQLLASQGQELLKRLKESRMDGLIAESMSSINDCWTTVGLTRGMSLLIQRMGEEFDHAQRECAAIQELLATAYRRFHDELGLEKLDPPPFSLASHRHRLEALLENVRDFCRDPMNLLMEKRFMVRKFYLGLVHQARIVFQQARMETETWLRLTLDPISSRIREHRGQLEQRLDNLNKFHVSLEALLERGGTVGQEVRAQEAQLAAIEAIAGRLAELMP